MTATTPVDRISELLTEAGYRKLSLPLRIAGLLFEFPAAFIGPEQSPDLVAVADTAFEPDKRILKKVEGLARALDVLRSTRPLTVVLAGSRPSSSTLDAMAKVCRVLPVGTLAGADPDVALRSWLAVLTPLRLPQPSSGIADPLGEVTRNVNTHDPVYAELIRAAPQGPQAVEARLYELVADALRDAAGADAT